MVEAGEAFKSSMLQFEKQHDLDALSRALEAVERSDWRTSVKPDERRAARGAILRRWLSLVQQIEAQIDPKFDPADLPEMKVAPPVVAGHALDSGASPASIKDPAPRRKYEEAIQANQKKNERYKYQTRLRRVKTRVDEEAKAFIGEAYTRSPDDLLELFVTLGGFITDPAKAESFLQAVEAPGN